MRLAVRTIVIPAATIAVAASVAGCRSTPTATTPTGVTVTGILVTGTVPTVGASAQLTANASMSDRTSADITSKAQWQSSNPAVATVGSTGNLTGVAVGSAEVTATYQGIVGKFAVTINAACAMTVQPQEVTIPSAGGSATVVVTATEASCAWLAQVDQGFLSIVGPIAANGSGSVTVAATSNAAGVARSGTLSISGRAVTIRQSQGACVNGVSPASDLFPQSGGTGTATVSAAPGCVWSVDTAASFVQVTSGSPGSGSASFTYSVPSNGAGAMRQATLTVDRFQLSVAQNSLSGTYVTFVSDPGDYIGAGKTQTFTPADFTFTADTYAAFNKLRVFLRRPDGIPIWQLGLSAPSGQQLQVATYTGVKRFDPFPGNFHAEGGLDFFGDGRGCNEQSGSFRIRELVFGADITVDRLWVTFEQHCSGAVPALRGDVAYVR